MERLQTVAAHGYASYKCPKCGRLIRTLADEAGDHGCSCGYDPEAEREFYDGLRTTIGCYVEECVERGSIPDAFAFAIAYQREYGRVPGEIIERMINEEVARY